MPSQPLILTLRMDEAAFRRFDALRKQHFPPERNFIPAHVTLFHHLPGDALEAVDAELAARAAAQPPFDLSVEGLRFLGRGVAFSLVSPELERLRADLARTWQDWLTPQDRQRLKPHITVQNKVAPAQARAVHEGLLHGFEPFTIRGEGLLLWRYRGGPWEAVAEYPFAGVAR